MRIKFILLQLLFLIVSVVQGQVNKPLDSNFDSFLNEVFINEGKIEPESRGYSYFKELFEKRIKFVELDKTVPLKQEYFQILEVPLNNFYNKNLKYDTTFRLESFNPFKYNINFYSKKTQVFLLGNSGFMMIIHPQEISSLNRL